MLYHPWRRGHRARVGTLGALTVTVLAMTAACGNDTASPSDPTSSTAPATQTVSTNTPGTTRAATPSGTATGSTPGASVTGVPRCSRGQLDLSLGRLSPGAGNLYAPLVFTNTGSATCSLHGYPGVSLLDESGHRIGRPARREGPTRPRVELAPGASAYAALHTVNKGVSGKPCLQPADQVQAYPPGSTWALRTDARSFRVCGEVFEVSAVRSGRHP
ncbi:DUF4232 domain-containing protein [Streptomyces sp. NPDC057257]|uniref:DUF4232 domain-containing protein n=1 Tax=Streptomyces sp. NPDC057257 TaxID=3346071 RepID=UPI00362F7B85